ncbi:MAG TPA: XdhC family protein [Jatrophihabitans sp.]|jgi:xanthine dehydrogenase accessory factor|nr:XdhC family protein [Jatrophihabitans sp.]
MADVDVLLEAARMSERGEEFALATVVWRQAPSSGQTGSRAIITASGVIRGWIGGACAEPAVLRVAREVIAERRSKLLLLGSTDQFGDAVPEGMTVVPISCQSDGALEVFVEPVVPSPQLVIVGRSPMAQTLAELAGALGWRAELHDAAQLSAAAIGPMSMVVVATQGHGDEDAIEFALAAAPAFVGLVASRKRGEAVLGYLADRGVPADRLERVRVPVGLDLGATSHREIAVAVLAELVQLRASGALAVAAEPAADVATAVDPVCGMTVDLRPDAIRFDHEGHTYYFCCAGCRSAFEKAPDEFTAREARC